MNDLLEAPYRHDAELSSYFRVESRVLANGAVLFVERDGTGMLYEAYSEVLAMMIRAVADEAKGPEPGPGKWLLPPDDLVAHHEQLASQLADELELVPTLLDLSVHSIEHLEGVRRSRGGRWMLTRRRINPVVAYLGTVVVRDVGGCWEVRSDPSGRRVACIVGRDGFRALGPAGQVIHAVRIGLPFTDLIGVMQRGVRPRDEP